jgi:VanZ family protein
MNYCSRVYHFIATRFPRKPVVYLCLFGIWGLTLWFLSAGNPAPKNGPEIPHVDKLAHFLYFSAGGALLTTVGLVFWPIFKNRRRRLFVLVALMCSVIGRLDEYHQTFTPGRSGNDTGDWLADTLGGAAGAVFVLFLILPGIRKVDRMLNKSMNK